MALLVRDAVARAYKELSYSAEGETPSAEMQTDGINALNDMLASWALSSIALSYPSASVWRGQWAEPVGYAVGDGVLRNGNVYVCTAAHTSGAANEPQTSPQWASYWTFNPPAVLPLGANASVPLPITHYRGFVALLALDMASLLNVEPSSGTLRKAQDGWSSLLADYMRIDPQQFEMGLTFTPTYRSYRGV